MSNKLFKKIPKGVFLKCISENKAYLAIFDVHSGSCDAHQDGHKVKWILFRQWVYWPTMLKNFIEFPKGCQECQKHVEIQHVPANKLHSVVKPGLFRGWVLELVGEIQPSSPKGHKYMLVGIYYFTKWVEEIPLTKVNQDALISFIQSHIIYWF